MITPKKIIFSLFILATLIGVTCLYHSKPKTEVNATPFLCVTSACINADRDYQQALAKAAEFDASANALQREVNYLNAEIAVIEASIQANAVIASELKERILATTTKLKSQESALIQLMIDMHFNQSTDAVKILASSNSISDLAEHQSRQETVETEVAIIAKEVRELKAKIEAEKAQVDAIIKEQEAKQAEIVHKRNRQTELVRKYRNDSAAYERDAATARKIRDAEIEKERQNYINNLGGGTLVDPGLNSYPKASQCPGINWRYTGDEHSGIWGGLYCECTSYAGWKAHEYRPYITISGWGDAKKWGSVARSKGWTVKTYQEAKAEGRDLAHSIGYWTSGTWGHVVWIEKDYGNGTVAYSEYNGAITANFSYNTGFDRYGNYTSNARKFNYIFLP